jgi:hypothetical protein
MSLPRPLQVSLLNYVAGAILELIHGLRGSQVTAPPSRAVLPIPAQPSELRDVLLSPLQTILHVSTFTSKMLARSAQPRPNGINNLARSRRGSTSAFSLLTSAFHRPSSMFSRFYRQLLSIQRFCFGSPANPMILKDHAGRYIRLTRLFPALAKPPRIWDNRTVSSRAIPPAHLDRPGRQVTRWARKSKKFSRCPTLLLR